MALRKLFSRRQPEPPAEPLEARTYIQQALDTLPIAPVRLFWDNLDEMRPWWPVLLPLLAWVGWRTYRRERAALLEQGEDAT
jgi:hypothetical protein